MMPREIIKVPGAHLLGSPAPVVVVDRQTDKAMIWVGNVPWGFGPSETELLNPSDDSILRHASRFVDRLRLKAEREAERKDRQDEAKRRERGGQ